jgi:hypothetical protein
MSNSVSTADGFPSILHETIGNSAGAIRYPSFNGKFALHEKLRTVFASRFPNSAAYHPWIGFVDPRTKLMLAESPVAGA